MTRRPDLVVVLAASLESNALGRALSLADLVPQGVPVEIWGPPTKSCWRTHDSIPIRGLNYRSLRNHRSRVRRMITDQKRVIFWVSKCYPFAVSALKGLRSGATIIADFDDHDVALAKEFRALHWRNRIVLNPLRSGSPERVTRSQRAILKLADATTVSSFSLAAALGIQEATVRVPHARPDLAPVEGRNPLEDSIGFLGTMRAHKGYDEICTALDACSNLTCVTFQQEGFPSKPEGHWRFLDPATPLVEAYGQIELAVLPMSASRGAQFQLPAKAIDAAAAGVPIAAPPTPVLLEYFGDALLKMSDWRMLGAALKKWREDGTLRQRGTDLHRIWAESLSIERVQKDILALFNTTSKAG